MKQKQRKNGVVKEKYGLCASYAQPHYKIYIIHMVGSSEFASAIEQRPKENVLEFTFLSASGSVWYIVS